jgi:hypothetical protein
MSATATIRVPVETRDSLARIAEQQGVSISRLLTQFADRSHLHALYAAERSATAEDLADAHTSAEYELWDEAGADGVD